MAVMQMRIRIKEDHLDPEPGRGHEKLLQKCCPQQATARIYPFLYLFLAIYILFVTFFCLKKNILRCFLAS